MDNKYLKRRKWIVVGAILLVLTLTITGTYALWNYFKVGSNQQLVAGDIYMKYTEGSTSINITNAMPTNTYDEKQVFTFTIEGKNTYTKPIWYEIVINWGEEPEDRHTRIPDKFLRFRLTEQLPGEEETEVIANGKYSDFSKGTKIWVNKIAANTRTDTKITYKLYMWVSDEMHLGAGDDANLSDMDMNTWNTDAFASVKVSVNGDFEEKELDKEPVEPVLAVKKIKDTLGQEGGIIGVTEDGEKTESLVSNIREYRYSGVGVNNYIYFNCQDEMEHNEDNCEKWRILGVFKDENSKEYIKILRNESLKSFPETYKVGETTYNITNQSGSSGYWNKKVEGEANNDWTTAGLQYWLNSKGDEGQDIGYLNSLYQNAQNMIVGMKYYLGNATYFNIPSVIYNQERSVSKVCSESCDGGDIWEGNQATWTGKIALAYPSDYAFTVDSQYWNMKAGGYSDDSFNEEIIKTSWLSFNSNWVFDSPTIATISPTTSKKDAVFWNYSREYSSYGLTSGSVDNNLDVYPTVYLNPDIMIVGGEGTEQSPYDIKLAS